MIKLDQFSSGDILLINSKPIVVNYTVSDTLCYSFLGVKHVSYLLKEEWLTREVKICRISNNVVREMYEGL